MLDEPRRITYLHDRFIDGSPCGFLSFSDQGEVLLINRYLLDRLGYTEEEVRLKQIAQLFSPAGRIFYQTHFFPLLKLQERVDEVYLSLRSKTGTEVPMLVSASRHDVEGVFVNNCVLLSMSQRLKMESELVRARRTAEESIRAKDEFIAIASHELRSPLTSILGWLQLLKETSAPELTQEALEAIERNAKLQEQLVSDMLDAARITTGKLRLNVERLTLVTVLKDALAVARPGIEAKDIHLNEEIAEDLSDILADPSRLQQIFWNILSNAIKFTPQGGVITVRAEQRDAMVQVQISDSGEGIPEDFLPYIFDRFRQADASKIKRHGGLGLGLSIVKELMELHGGSIQASSKGVGKGATFELCFPVFVGA